uniref:Putative secreted protein n=1 Tax=Ixodes ricinus TaxID=34613 RepID=A0A6B0U7W6_IXORI
MSLIFLTVLLCTIWRSLSSTLFFCLHFSLHFPFAVCGLIVTERRWHLLEYAVLNNFEAFYISDEVGLYVFLHVDEVGERGHRCVEVRRSLATRTRRQAQQHQK